MTALAARLNSWWNSRVTSEIEIRQSAKIEQLESDLAVAKELLETERVKNRVQEVEIKQLTAVIGRDFERVRRETKNLGGTEVVKSDQIGVLA